MIEPTQTRCLKIGYLVHDVDDAAVTRRLIMLERSGCDPVLCGFRRSHTRSMQGDDSHILGTTHDGALFQRVVSVLKNLLFCKALRETLADCEVLVARNLEMLILAHRLKDNRPVVYECLDIHRTLLGSSIASRFIQNVEDRLVRASHAIWTSSPGFIRHYFSRKPNLTVPITLLENKVLNFRGPGERPFRTKPAPPWTIGWFGMLRCQRTFDILAQLGALMPGAVNVLIAGKPSPSELSTFAADIEHYPHMSYVGPYKSEDLMQLYAQCHFAWCIDWFEEGLNSAWLLPNRIYEASAQTVVPIALEDVETGTWLKARRAGLLTPSGGMDLVDQLKRLTPVAYRALQESIIAIPDTDIFADEAECLRLRSCLENLT